MNKRPRPSPVGAASPVQAMPLPEILNHIAQRLDVLETMVGRPADEPPPLSETDIALVKAFLSRKIEALFQELVTEVKQCRDL